METNNHGNTINNSNTTTNSVENKQNQTENSERVSASISQPQVEETKNAETIGAIIADETNWRSVLRQASERETKLARENDGLCKENSRLRNELRAYNDLNLLASQGFDANRYDDIRKLCDNNITEEKLKDLKKKRDFVFLLEKTRGIDTSRLGEPEKDLWSKWLTESNAA